MHHVYLTVSGDFIGRVQPPVSTWRRADVQMEMDVVSQPVAALLVPHEYWLLPVLWSFTLVVKKREGKQQVQGRLMRELAPFITAEEIDFHFSFSVMEWGTDRERRTLALCLTTVHSPAVTHTPGHYSGCPSVSGEMGRVSLTCGLCMLCIWVMKVSSRRSTKDLAVLKQWLNIKQTCNKTRNMCSMDFTGTVNKL